MSRSSKQEKCEQIRKIMAEIKTDELSGYLSNSDFSDYSDLSFSGDDGLSAISDVSSVASFHLSPPSKKQKRQSEKPRQKSRIPVPANKSTHSRASDSMTSKHPIVSLAKKIEAKPIQIMQPTNFLAPDLTGYSKLAVCIFEGADFPRTRFGERNTYVVVNLHRQLDMVIKSPICFNRTTNAVYNAGFDIDVLGLDFSAVVPVIEVFDFISEEQSELIGLGYVQLQMARQDGDICIVLQDEWVNIVTVNTRAPCGRVKMSLIFHNEDTDVTEFIRKKEPVAAPAREVSQRVQPLSVPVTAPSAQKKACVVEEEKPATTEMSVQAEETIVKGRRENNIMDMIGELSLTFNSPMKPKRSASFDEKKSEKMSICDDSSDIPTRVPVKPQIRKKEEKAMVYITESDLDLSDDIVPISRPVEDPKPSKTIKVPLVRRKAQPEKPAEQPVTETKKTETETQKEKPKAAEPVTQGSSLRDRFKGYANYFNNMY